MSCGRTAARTTERGEAAGQEEKFRAGYAAVNRGDMPGVLSFLDPEIEWDMSRSFPDGPVYLGHNGVRRFFSDVNKLWDEFRLEIEELHAAGDDMVVIGWWSARGKGSTVPIRERGGWVWRMRAGKAVRMRFYLNPLEALDAANS